MAAIKGRTLHKLNSVAVEDLSEQDRAKIEKTFRSFDRKNTGSISTEMLGTALRSMRLVPSEREIEAFIRKADNEKTGKISLKKFIFIAAHFWYSDVKEFESLLWKAFLVFDKLDKGALTVDQMRLLLTEMGEPIPEKEAEAIIKSEIDKDGFVDYKGLVRLWLR